MSKLYEQVADQIVDLVEKGVYSTGDRIPSVRSLSRQMEVSATTVVEAYRLLEDQGVLESRPQSGFYVKSRRDARCPKVRCPAPETAVPVEVGDLIVRVLNDARLPGIVSFSGADAAPDLLPARALQRAVSRAAALQESLASYDLVPGNRELRIQVARRAAEAGMVIAPEEVVLTTGCQEALTLSLRAVCRPGDVVAIESPTFYGQLQALEMLGLRVLEIPTDPVEGMSLDALRLALDQMPVRAVVATPSFSNPTGSEMSQEHRQGLVSLLAEREIPLIEDDVYGDLGFSTRRTPAARSFDTRGLVLYCSSFSKTLAPGYRLGWAVPGRFQPQVERLKLLSNLASPSLMARGVASFLQGSAYERYLRRLRRVYASRTAAMREAVLRHFPAGTRVSNPRGGFVLWLELPPGFDTITLYPTALQAGVSFAPGPIFSAARRYQRCMRLTASQWDPVHEEALRRLAVLLQKSASSRSDT